MIKLENELLFEMATVHRDNNENISIAVNPDGKHVLDSYFKFYNAADFSKATAVIRIMFDSPRYTKHSGDGKKLWVLNSDDKKLLMRALMSPSKKYKAYGFNVWDATKFEWNYEYLKIDIEPDEYIAGTYDEMYKDIPSYVPSTLKMPDYMQIEF